MLTDRWFDGGALLFFLGAAIVGVVISVIVNVRAGRESSIVALRAVEVLLLTFIGGFLARAFLSLLLSAGNDSPDAGTVLALAFFPIPAILLELLRLIGISSAAANDVNTILALAAGFGVLVGMADGLGRVHNWLGLGIPGFVLDTTWGLTGSVHGGLMHLINVVLRATYSADVRSGAHRYESGFRIKGGFAFTQGSVMSNLRSGPGTGIFVHERTHVWQNRLFGPIFTWGYALWMAVMFIPGIIAGPAKGTTVGDGIMKLCYYNNPYEAWAYKFGGTRSGALVWTDGQAILGAVLFYIPFLILVVLLVTNVW
jgi:hypothetical protein